MRLDKDPNFFVIEQSDVERDKIPELLNKIFLAEYSLTRNMVTRVAGPILGVRILHGHTAPLIEGRRIRAIYFEQRFKLAELLESVLEIVKERPLEPGDLDHLRTDPASYEQFAHSSAYLKTGPNEAASLALEITQQTGQSLRALAGEVSVALKISRGPVLTHLKTPLLGPPKNIKELSFRESVEFALRKILLKAQGVTLDQILAPDLAEELAKVSAIEALNPTITRQELYGVLERLTEIPEIRIRNVIHCLEKKRPVLDKEAFLAVSVGLSDCLNFLKADPFFVNGKSVLSHKDAQKIVELIMEKRGLSQTDALAESMLSSYFFKNKKPQIVTEEQHQELALLIRTLTAEPSCVTHEFEVSEDVDTNPGCLPEDAISATNIHPHFGWTEISSGYYHNGAGGRQTRPRRYNNLLGF